MERYRLDPRGEADVGRFVIPRPADEARLIQEMTERAVANDDHPGEWWARIAATRRRGPRKLTGYRIYHLDLNAGMLIVTEQWDGIETARRVHSLTEH